jgi:hypothetical protein
MTYDIKWWVTLNKFPYMGGWGNGYVAVPLEHPWYGLDCDEIDVDIHGGLTFSEEIDNYWVFGFDTNHYGDNLLNWPKLRVIDETMRLFITAIEIMNIRLEKDKL